MQQWHTQLLVSGNKLYPVSDFGKQASARDGVQGERFSWLLSWCTRRLFFHLLSPQLAILHSGIFPKLEWSKFSDRFYP